MIRSVLAACAVLCALTTLADARPRHHHRATAGACAETGTLMQPTCGSGVQAAPSNDFLQGVRSIRVTMHRERRADAGTQLLGGRPAGCPARFCGCGASLHLFGRIVPGLNLAANWLRFPRALPAPRMAAARRGHVFVLEQHLQGNVWLVFDANSGGHQTRLHARSIAGYAIVNPHAGAV